MFYRNKIKNALAFSLVGSLLLSGLLSVGASAQQQQDSSATQDKSRPRRTNDQPQTTPTPKPSPKKDDDVTLQDDEVLRVETDLTNILFTAVDKNKAEEDLTTDAQRVGDV